jgi:hypothetical protein
LIWPGHSPVIRTARPGIVTTLLPEIVISPSLYRIIINPVITVGQVIATVDYIIIPAEAIIIIPGRIPVITFKLARSHLPVIITAHLWAIDTDFVVPELCPAGCIAGTEPYRVYTSCISFCFVPAGS